MSVDPVCGIEFEEDDVDAVAKYMGKVYYFCSDECREEFEESPEDYVAVGAEEITEE